MTFIDGRFVHDTDGESLPDKIGVLNEQLEQAETEVSKNTKKFERKLNEVDYVGFLKSHAKYYDKFIYKITGDRSIEVGLQYENDRAAFYNFSPDTQDGLIRLRAGDLYTFLEDQEVELSRTNYESGELTGTWSTSAENAHYTTEIDAKITKTFTGSGIDFSHYADDRGGIFEVYLDGNYQFDYSTFSATTEAPKTTNLFSGLTDEEHTVELVFNGDDPENTPSGGAGTARGWVWYGTAGNSRTWHLFGLDTLKDTLIRDVFAVSSNKEFAFKVRPLGSTEDYEWVPSHASVSGVSELLKQTVFIDGVKVTDWTETRFNEAENIEIEQLFYGKHPSEPNNPLFLYTVIYTINSQSIKVKCIFNFRKNTEIQDGYPIMLPVLNSFGYEFLVSQRIKYDSSARDGSRTNLPTPSQSVAFLDPNDDVLAAVTFDNLNDIMRNSREGVATNQMWVHHRTDLQKLYPHVFQNHTAKSGDAYEYSGEFMIGKADNINELAD